MNSSSKYGAEAGIHNELAVRRGKKCSKLYAPLCSVSGLLMGLSLHLAQLKRISPWLAGRKTRLRVYLRRAGQVQAFKYTLTSQKCDVIPGKKHLD